MHCNKPQTNTIIYINTFVVPFLYVIDFCELFLPSLRCYSTPGIWRERQWSHIAWSDGFEGPTPDTLFIYSYGRLKRTLFTVFELIKNTKVVWNRRRQFFHLVWVYRCLQCCRRLILFLSAYFQGKYHYVMFSRFWVFFFFLLFFFLINFEKKVYFGGGMQPRKSSLDRRTSEKSMTITVFNSDVKTYEELFKAGK